MPGSVIIGGGPAGATAAILLARAGRAVTLIERNAGPADKVCGDFVSAEALGAITALGVDIAALAPSHITSVRLVHGKRVATAQLPFPACGLTRRALDEALLRQAELSGATVLRGCPVRGINRSNGSLWLDCSSGATVTADTVFLATGKHNLRGAARPVRGTGLVGMKMYYALDPCQQIALRGHVELILFAGGYAGLQLVESDRAVLCVLVPGARLRAVDGRWDKLFDSLVHECPHLAERLAGARPMLERPLAIAGLPYGYTHEPDEQDLPDLFRLGDQATVIASLTGDGVALALASATLASRIWLAHGNAAGAYHLAWARHLASQMRLSSLIHRVCLAPAAQPWLLLLCRSWPRAMRLAASRTRMRADTFRSASATEQYCGSKF
jgi:flavin-dependent dehydrogenase